MDKIIKPTMLINVPSNPNDVNEFSESLVDNLKDDFSVIVTYDLDKPFSIDILTNDPNFKVISVK